MKTSRSKRIQISAALGVFLFAMACGQGTDPGLLAGDPKAVPQMIFPIAQSNVSGGTYLNAVVIAPFIEGTRDGFEFYQLSSSFVGGNMAVIAPVAGVISRATTENNLGIVDIRFNGIYTIRVTGISTFQVRAGDYVSQGSLIGYVLGQTTANLNSGVTFSNGAGFRLSVYGSGTALCPMSFFSQAGRQVLFTSGNLFSNVSTGAITAGAYGSLQPCQ